MIGNCFDDFKGIEREMGSLGLNGNRMFAEKWGISTGKKDFEVSGARIH